MWEAKFTLSVDARNTEWNWTVFTLAYFISVEYKLCYQLSYLHFSVHICAESKHFNKVCLYKCLLQGTLIFTALPANILQFKNVSHIIHTRGGSRIRSHPQRGRHIFQKNAWHRENFGTCERGDWWWGGGGWNIEKIYLVLGWVNHIFLQILFLNGHTLMDCWRPKFQGTFRYSTVHRSMIVYQGGHVPAKKKFPVFSLC